MSYPPPPPGYGFYPPSVLPTTVSTAQATTQTTNAHATATPQTLPSLSATPKSQLESLMNQGSHSSSSASNTPVNENRPQQAQQQQQQQGEEEEVSAPAHAQEQQTQQSQRDSESRQDSSSGSSATPQNIPPSSTNPKIPSPQQQQQQQQQQPQPSSNFPFAYPASASAPGQYPVSVPAQRPSSLQNILDSEDRRTQPQAHAAQQQSPQHHQHDPPQQKSDDVLLKKDESAKGWGAGQMVQHPGHHGHSRSHGGVIHAPPHGHAHSVPKMDDMQGIPQRYQPPPHPQTPSANGQLEYWDKDDVDSLRELLEIGERAKWKYISGELTRERNKRITAVACQKKFKDLFGVAEASSILGSSLCYVVSPQGWASLPARTTQPTAIPTPSPYHHHHPPPHQHGHAHGMPPLPPPQMTPLQGVPMNPDDPQQQQHHHMHPGVHLQSP